MTTEELAVLAANRAFYQVFARRDYDAMDALWSQKSNIACIHPGWHVLHGRSEVMASWKAILESDAAPEIECSQAHAVVVGDSAFVTCVETLSEAELVATNIFVREDGGWRLVHHQAGPFARRPPRAAREALN